MKRIALLFAAITMAIGVNASKDQEVGPYTVSEVIKGVWHIQDYNSENPAGETFNEAGEKTHFNNCSDMYLLVGKEKALLIDLSNNVTWAPNADKSLRQLVSDRAAGKPLTITFTHNHGDHTGMLKAYSSDPDVHFALPSIDFQSMKARFPQNQITMIDEGYDFDLGGMTVNTVLVPGHTAGSVVFFLKGKNLLFSGDAIGSGHGVWIFNTAGFDNYVKAVPHLIEYINKNKINKKKLQIYGGHYWQKDWLTLPAKREIGMEYINQMQELINQIMAGNAYSEPSDLGRADLDTYFKNGNAIIVWNKAQADAYAKSK